MIEEARTVLPGMVGLLVDHAGCLWFSTHCDRIIRFEACRVEEKRQEQVRLESGA